MSTEKEEGDKCAEPGCEGKLIYVKNGECTCHLHPPCWACTNSYLACDTCYEEAE